jgi:serine/threonine-protein kinase
MATRKPKKVGNYEIAEVLGKGGMGEVYLGEHALLERQVAIKRLTISDEKQKAHFEERFRREGRALAQLHHQGIVDVYDLFSWRNDLYMVIEFVDGFDLADLLDMSSFLPVDVAAIIALRMAEALEHAHFHRIIHRDIKPANVMVSREGEVRLMDFGVARDETLDAVTKTGMMVGTPLYLAPEVVSGDGADERSDLYALGATLYQMLSGRRVFEHANSDNLYHLIAQGKFPAVHKVQPGLPRAMRKIVARCLQRKPERRYQSASELRVALERFLISHGAWANGNERLVGFLAGEGHISEAEALTVINADSLVLEEAHELEPPGRASAALAVLVVIGLAVAGISWAAGWLDGVLGSLGGD